MTKKKKRKERKIGAVVLVWLSALIEIDFFFLWSFPLLTPPLLPFNIILFCILLIIYINVCWLEVGAKIWNFVAFDVLSPLFGTIITIVCYFMSWVVLNIYSHVFFFVCTMSIIYIALRFGLTKLFTCLYVCKPRVIF